MEKCCYHKTTKDLLVEWGLPYDVSYLIVEQYIMKAYSRKIYNILKYGITVRKNYYSMKSYFKHEELNMIGILEPLWGFFDSISSLCTCPMCSENPENPSCYVKNMIYRSLSKYYINVPLYKRGTYEKYIGYITRKLTSGKRKTCKKNIIKIAKLIADFGIKLEPVADVAAA